MNFKHAVTEKHTTTKASRRGVAASVMLLLFEGFLGSNSGGTSSIYAKQSVCESMVKCIA